MITFEDNIPRSLNFDNPYFVTNPDWYADAYKKMVGLSLFPASFGNGLFNLLIGIWVCIIGFACMLIGPSPSQLKLALPVGIVAGAVISILYVRYMHRRILFPRGGCMPPSAQKTKVYLWLVPMVIYIAIAVGATLFNDPLYVSIIVGVVFGCIELVAFAKCNKTSMMGISLLLVVVPFLMAYFGLSYSSDPLYAVILAFPNLGIVLVLCGTLHTQASISPSAWRETQERVRRCLEAKNPRRRFVGAAFLCNNIDTQLLPELLEMCWDENRTVACTAQIAVGNTWGPIPREVLLPSHATITSEMPEAQAKMYTEQYSEHRNATVNRWKEHFLKIDELIKNMVEEESESVELIFRLASGENIMCESARSVAIQMLGAMRTPRAYAMLMTLLQHRDRAVYSAAISGFYGADSKAILYLERFFAAEFPWQRIRAMRATRNLLNFLAVTDVEEHAVAQALLEQDIDALLDTDDTCTFAEAITLLPCEDKEDFEVLEGYCTNSRPIIRIMALCSITRERPEQAEPWVVPALGDRSAAVRYAAIKCIVKLRLPDSERLFSRMLMDPHPRIAKLAEESIARINMLRRPIST